MNKLKPCPFCGGEAKVIVSNKKHCNFEIIGCSPPSMICPNPSMTAYKVNGKFDYTYWNRRTKEDK